MPKTNKFIAAVMVCTMVCFFLPRSATAHNLDIGFSNITLKENGLRYELLLLPDEMSPLLSLDLNRDGAVTMEEANQMKPDLEKLVAQSLSIKADDVELQSHLESLEITQRGPGVPMVKLNIDYSFGKKVDEVVIDYNLLFNISPLHRNLATVTSLDGSAKEHNFEKNNRILNLYMDPNSPKALVNQLVNIKIPIWILFMMLLLVGAVMIIIIIFFKRMKKTRRKK
ncbi:hypothetical protein [Paenibacillus planticolens]|uniref:DUF3153 domain-containing protein n=1 Tax=Paenibacillus planticolens TaxID=2654976 RepID=A0ABX2A0P8_9BACL|nr:hypothetical protein [Paenibacillus planticolens]NOV04714.1 hypothetical protein [Paenibacillus planticolens]